MGTTSFVKTDLYALHGVVQNTMMSYAKELIIETLREEFSKDSYYHYVRDVWGFANRIDLTDVPTEAGLNDDITTRIFIGESYGYDGKFYPAVLVTSGGFKSVPISMSRNKALIQYKAQKIIDGYGNQKIFSTPSHFSLAGAWEGNINIDILAGDVSSRDEIAEIVSSILTITNFESLQYAGVVVKPISVGSPSEVDDYKDKLYKIPISCDVRTEWAQNIPISKVIDIINFCINFGDLNNPNPTFSPNLQINESINLFEIINSL